MDIGRLMLAGQSWSGRERDVVWLNRGGARFADISAAAGLDFIEDGRALAVSDWDGDGRVDLLLRNRNAPGLRFLHGNGTRQHWFALQLEGVKCNRDAIGARVRLRTAGGAQLRELRAGDGYLAQSSKRLHFGLGADARIEHLSVRWPDGSVQEFEGLAADQAFSLRQGDAPRALPQRGAVVLQATAEHEYPVLKSTRMVLRTPLPLPQHLRPANNLPLKSGTTAVIFWDPADAASMTALQELSSARAQLEAAGLNVGLLCTSADDGVSGAPPGDLFREQDAAWWTRVPRTAQPALRAVVDALRGASGGPVISALILDSLGRLQSVHCGPLQAELLHRDALAYRVCDSPHAPRASFAGRWYYGHLPDIEGLAAAVRRIGDNEATGFYVLMALELKRRAPQRR